jgi:hypothetical protein
MKFSTLDSITRASMGGLAYHFRPGITFNLERSGATSRVSSVGSAVNPDYGFSSRYNSLPVSDELLVSKDVLVRQYRGPCSGGYGGASDHKITVVRGAIREIEETPFVLAESEQASCEAIRRAHAICIPAGTEEIAKLGNEKLSGQILLPRFAVLAEGDTLDVHILKLTRTNVGLLKGCETNYVVDKTFQISFDGTALQLHGVDLAVKSQECFA